MKKLISVLLCALLLFSLVGCDKDLRLFSNEKIPAYTKELTLDKASLYLHNQNSDFEDMKIELVSAVWNDNEITLNISFKNNTSYEVMYGEGYDIEREVNGKWESCVALDDLTFNALGYLLKAGEQKEKSYNITNSFYIHENGRYRFNTYCFIYDKEQSDTTTKCEMWVEFTVKRIGDTENDLKRSYVDFKTQYIRTGSYYSDGEYPSVVIIRSVDELNAYYEANKKNYYLERREVPPNYVDVTIGFLDACDKYTAEYFKNNILVMVLLEEGSGSITHQIENIKIDTNNKLFINIDSIVPFACTNDMANWHILIELKKDLNIKSEADVTVYLDGADSKVTEKEKSQLHVTPNFILTIPYDWQYEPHQKNELGEYAISFWPKGQNDGKIKMCHLDSFEPSGNNIFEERIKVGSLYARQCRYKNSNKWDYINFSDTLEPTRVIALNEGADNWWEYYEDEALSILASRKNEFSVYQKDSIIRAASTSVTYQYEVYSTRYDIEKDLWIVTFLKNDNTGPYIIVSLTPQGERVSLDYRQREVAS